MAFPDADAEPKMGEGEFKENLNNILICPDCREIPPNLIEEFSSGDMVCGSCGLVVGDRIIDTRSEWRTFSNDDQNGDDPSRVGDGPNLLLEGSQLETTIAREGGKTAKVLANAQNKLSNDKSTKALLSAYREIGTLTDSINAGKTVADAAKHIYKLVEDHKFMKGKPQEAIIAGCIFIACRQNQVPRTFREIFALTRVSKKEIGRVFKQLEAFLAKAQKSGMAGAGLQDAENASNRVATSADVLCGRYCSHLQFKNVQKIEKLSRLLATKAPTRPQLAGRSPLSVAAACIYLASYGLGEPRAPRDIAKIAGVSDGTIKTVYKFMFDIRDDLIEPSWLPAGLSMEKFMEALPAN